MSDKYLEAIERFAYETAKRMLGEEDRKKEAPTMQATYNGFTGELEKLERRVIPGDFIRDREATVVYDLSIYDSEKQVTHSFTGVKLKDVRFLGGAVTFGG